MAGGAQNGVDRKAALTVNTSMTMFSEKPNSNRCAGRLLFGWLLLAAPATPLPAVESGVPDIRRDATVIAVERVGDFNVVHQGAVELIPC